MSYCRVFARKDERRQRHHATTKQALAADWLDHSLRTSLLHRDDHWNSESAGWGVPVDLTGHWLSGRSTTRSDSHGGPGRIVRLCAAKGPYPLERTFDLPSETTAPRVDRQGYAFRTMFRLPWISNAHGFRAPRRGRMARPRSIHARRHAVQLVLAIR